jgi:YVTN family beta-propeller protein
MKFKPSAINCTVAISLALAVCAEAQNYFVFVSNERSGDVSVIDGATDAVVATFKVGKRPRGIHATPDGARCR